jgi:NADPH2:quinone reductase
MEVLPVMRAMQISELGGPEAVRLTEVAEPAGDGQVVVDLHAAGVAFPDLLMTRGLYQVKPALPFVMGSEAAGVVRSAPAGSRWKPGDRVAAFLGMGGWSEVAVVDEGALFALPDIVSFESGAGLLMNYLTMHFAYRVRCQVREGQTVLVHGAAGGVGVAALELAAAYGLRSIAVVSSPEKAELATQAGASHTVDVEGWLAAALELTGGAGVDHVVDPVGGDRFLDSIRSLAPQGRLMVIGFAAGEIPTVAANRLLLKNVDVVGINWGGWILGHPGFQHEQWAQLAPLLASGAVRGITGASFALEDAGQALRAIDERRALGKVVLRIR